MRGEVIYSGAAEYKSRHLPLDSCRISHCAGWLAANGKKHPLQLEAMAPRGRAHSKCVMETHLHTTSNSRVCVDAILRDTA